MADSTILIEIKSDGTGARVIKRDLDEIAKKSDKATAQTGKFNDTLGKTGNLARNLKASFAGLFATLTVGAISGITDEFKLLSSRLEQSTLNSQEFSKSMTGLLNVSRQTGASLADAVSVFQRLSFVRSEINATVDEMISFTGTVQKLGIISGASTQALSAGLTQLGQGLSAGVLRAEEFNSVVENIPVVAKAISEEFGVTTGELRKLVLAGEVLSEDVFTAIINQTEKANEQFDKMPLTIGRAFAQLRQDIGVALAGIDETSDATSNLAILISKLGDVALGIGNVFEGVFSFIQSAMAGVATAIFGILEGITRGINAVIAGINRIPGVNIGQLSIVDDFTSLRQAQQRVAVDRFRGLGEGLVNAGGNIADIFTGREQLADAEKSTREISKNYADIAKSVSEASEKSSATNRSLSNTSKLTKDIGENFNNVANDFGDGLVDAFRRGFEGGEGFLGRFTAGVRNAMQNLFADITRVIAQPIFRNIASGVVGAGAGAASGGFSLSSLSSLSSVLNGGGPITLGGLFPSGIGRSLGFAQSLPKGVFGPAAPGSIFGSTTLGGALSGGAIGGLAANLFGLGSGNFVQDTAFGGAGTLAGAFLGGPIGAGIGSFLGTALGGLFGGGKPSDKSQFSTLDLATLGVETTGLTGKKFSQENRDFADRVTQEASNLAQLLKHAGATLGGSLQVIVGNRDGLRVNGQNFGNDSDAFIQGITQAVLDSVADAPSDLTTLLSNTQGFDTAELAEALGILELIRSFEDLGEASRPLGDALDALDEQFNELRNRTQELGLPTDKLTESYERQKDTLIRDVLSPLQDFLDQQALSSSSSLNPTQRLSLARSAFDENLAAIQGGDFSNLSQLTNQASQLLSIGRDVFASGAGFTALESFVRQSVAGVAGDLGAEGGLNDSIFREITLSNAQQISLQEQMLLELREAREENIRLRKAMERVGNSLVVSS